MGKMLLLPFLTWAKFGFHTQTTSASKRKKKMMALHLSEEADNYLPAWCDSYVNLRAQQTVELLCEGMDTSQQVFALVLQGVKITHRCEGVCDWQCHILN